MDRVPACLFAAALVAAYQARADIVIEGTVALPPARIAHVTQRYQQMSGEVAQPDPPAAIVYVESAGGGAPAPGTVAQKGYQFSPGLTAVQTGAAVMFQNQDDDYHHVFSYSKAKSFDLGRYRKDEAAPVVTFDRPGTVIVGCEIHDHMRGTILVLDSPWFVKSAFNGSYRLVVPDGLAGPVKLKAWISDRDVRERALELAPGATLKADFPTP
jgi:plastocyanin